MHTFQVGPSFFMTENEKIVADHISLIWLNGSALALEYEQKKLSLLCASSMLQIEPF